MEIKTYSDLMLYISHMYLDGYYLVYFAGLSKSKVMCDVSIEKSPLTVRLKFNLGDVAGEARLVKMNDYLILREDILQKIEYTYLLDIFDDAINIQFLKKCTEITDTPFEGNCLMEIVRNEYPEIIDVVVSNKCLLPLLRVRLLFIIERVI